MKTNSSFHQSSLRRVLSLLLFGAAVAIAVCAISPSRASRTQDQGAAKIAPWVLQNTANGNTAEFLVVLSDQADLSGAEVLTTKEEKGRYVYNALWTKAQTTQAPLLQWLTDHKIEHRSYYIVNFVWVKAGLEVAQTLATRADVQRIEGNPLIRNIPDPLPVTDEAPSQPDAITAIEPGISYSRAPEVWAAGFNGQGIVVGGGDTGYRWTHNALKNHYRGWDGTTANHDYNWHDSIHSGGGSCGPNSVQPCDDNGHGTHTIGTAIGDDGAGNQIGMAPGAKWIGCRNMNVGVGTPATYMECFEFFLAPYPVGGTPAQGNPTLAPHVTTNSWGCPPSEGCSALTLQSAVEAQRSAGIVTVAAAGNAGSGCSTVSDPPSLYDAVYSVGALSTGTDTIASFSSRGPVTADGSNRMKPDISAPGTSTRSSYRTSDTSYTSLSGTSMASPHVAGGVALLLSARPSLRGNVMMTRSVMNQSAVHVMSTLCSSSGTPNNVYGNGRMDVRATLDQLLLIGAVSRKSHSGAGALDINLPLSGNPGVECRNSGGNHSVVLTFTNPVVSGSASVTGGSGTVSGSPAFSGNTMTVNLGGVADAQTLTISLSNVADTTSHVLSAATVSMNLLVADTNGDKAVNAGDALQTRNRAGQATDASNFRSDVNLDGSVNSGDTLIVRARSGNFIP